MIPPEEKLLADMLLRWEELRDLGQDAPANELCESHPHLTEELSRRIHALEVTSWLDKPIHHEEVSRGVALLVGEARTLIGRYRLDDLIAEGGFAQVWRGYDLELQRNVAVKLPKPSRLQSADEFVAEARRVARLKHPGIVPVFDVGREGDLCFIISEFVEGGSLGDHLINHPPSQQRAIQWIAEVADALTYAHLNGIIHRDIKPANILIDHHSRALLTDFGIASSSNNGGQQALSFGTLRYTSPEQLVGENVDPRADVFSLGIVLHEALTGTLPYSTDEPNVLRREIATGITSIASPDIPAPLKRICRKALRRESHFRYASAAELAADLKSCVVTLGSGSWVKLTIFLSTLLAVVCSIVFAMFNHEANPLASAPASVKAFPTTVEQPSSHPARLATQRPSRFITNSIGMELAWIPPGDFVMGSPKDETGRSSDETQHRVTLTKGFYLGVYEVTRSQFARFVEESHHDSSDWKAEWLPQANDYPVTCVNWDDALDFCRWLSKREKVVYRLPTEAEWEYACRAGSRTAYHFGPGITKDDAHFDRNNDSASGSLVGSYAPNAWGLHDMHGNVFEWCADAYGPYAVEDVTDPVGLRTSENRVCRSGCYWKDRFNVRSASRQQRPSSLRGYDSGFRVVKVTTPDEPPANRVNE